MKEIISGKGDISIVDDVFYDELCKYSWRKVNGPRTSYFHTSVNYETISMHRLLLSIAYSIPITDIGVVDHINRNGLDNRLTNLRIVTDSESCQNRNHFDGCHSKFTGVSKSTYGNKWVAYISKNGRIHLGTFESEDRAATIYDVAAIKLYGRNAKINFENKRDKYCLLVDSGINPIPEKHISYSKHSGITYRKDIDKWQSYITPKMQENIEGCNASDKRISIGMFDTEECAIEAYDNAIKKLSENKEIITPHQAKVKAPYNGVQLNKSGKYIARIVHNKERHSLDTYDTPEEAAEVYDCALIILHGDLSKLNFPTKIDEYKTKISDGYNPIQEKKAKTSKYKGISYRKDKKKWEAYIQDPETKKRKRLGYFTTENDAIEAVNESKQK